MNSIGAAHIEVTLLTLIAVGGYWMEPGIISCILSLSLYLSVIGISENI